MTETQNNFLDDLVTSLDGEREEETLKEPSYDGAQQAKAEPPAEEEEPAEAEGEETEEEAETAAEPAEEPKRKGKEQETIPYARFREVIDQRREARESAETLRSEVAELRGQLTEMLRSRDAKPLPDPNEDPDAYITHINAEYERLRQDHENLTTQQREAQQHSADVQKVIQYTQERVQDFQAEHPDYFNAYNHLQTKLINDRIEMGYSPQGAQAEVQNLAAQAMQHLYQTGGDPARYVYSLAVREGYKPPGAEGEAEAEAEAEAAPRPKRKPVDVEKAKKANRSVATKGQAAERDLSELDPDSMTHEQFMQYLERLKKERSQDSSIMW